MSLRPRSPRNASNELHPVVYRAAAALLVWFVAAAWLLFGGPGYIDLALAMISVLVFAVIAVLAALRRTGNRSRRMNGDSAVSNDADGGVEGFVSWLQGEFSTWTDRRKGSSAAVEILLPIAAVAIGITTLGIVLELVRAQVI